MVDPHVALCPVAVEIMNRNRRPGFRGNAYRRPWEESHGEPGEGEVAAPSDQGGEFRKPEVHAFGRNSVPQTPDTRGVM